MLELVCLSATIVPKTNLQGHQKISKMENKAEEASFGAFAAVRGDGRARTPGREHAFQAVVDVVMFGAGYCNTLVLGAEIQIHVVCRMLGSSILSLRFFRSCGKLGELGNCPKSEMHMGYLYLHTLRVPLLRRIALVFRPINRTGN